SRRCSASRRTSGPDGRAARRGSRARRGGGPSRPRRGGSGSRRSSLPSLNPFPTPLRIAVLSIEAPHAVGRCVLEPALIGLVGERRQLAAHLVVRPAAHLRAGDLELAG